MLAAELDKEGHSMNDVVKAIKTTEVRPTKENLKEVIWKPVQQALFGTTSTTELTTEDVGRVYEVINRFVAMNFHTHVPFPSVDTKLDEFL